MGELPIVCQHFKTISSTLTRWRQKVRVWCLQTRSWVLVTWFSYEHKAASDKKTTQTVRLRETETPVVSALFVPWPRSCFGGEGPGRGTARGCRVPAPRSADLYFALPCPSSTPSRPRPASSKQSAGLATLLNHHWPFSPSHQLGHCNLLIVCLLSCAPLTLLIRSYTSSQLGLKLFQGVLDM